MLDAGAEVCGRSPVRTIGGCSRVEIAVEVQLANISSCTDHLRGIPFWPDSPTDSDQLLDEISKAPPTEEIDPVADPRLG